MTATTQASASTTCPAWCEAPHDEDHTLHYQQGASFPDLYGKPVEVSAFTGKNGRSGIYLGCYEIGPETARLIVLELADAAGLVEQESGR